MPAIELQDLGIDEVSGVDAPANAIPGWMVLKAEDGTEVSMTPEQVQAQLATLYGALGSARAIEGAPDEIRKAAEELAQYVEKQLEGEDTEEPLIRKMKKLFKKQRKEIEKAREGEPEADVEKASDETRKPGKTAPADGNDDLAAAQEPDVHKAVKKAVRKALAERDDEITKAMGPVIDDMGTFREVIEKVLDRVEALEDMIVGSAQAYGQESAPVEKSEPTLRDAILSAAAGNRVTIN